MRVNVNVSLTELLCNVSLLNEDYLRAGFHISKRRSLSLPGLDDTTRIFLVLTMVAV